MSEAGRQVQFRHRFGEPNGVTGRRPAEAVEPVHVERFRLGRIGSLFVGRGVDLDDRRGA